MTDPFREQLQEALASTFTLDRELTGGGMSRVFVATERALGRTVVIKVLPPELAAGVNRERFRREIQLSAQLHHPHIVPVLSAGELGELLYYTMPYIDGESLRSRLEHRGPLSVRSVIRILRDVVDALAYAHARGIVHRDIKPGNILSLGSHALVTDFGVAKALSAAMPLAGVTTSGMAIGTPAYMAPEQLAGDPAADHRVDIYATGLLAYELLTGASPFKGSSPQAVMAAQLTRVPESLHICCPDVPPELSAVIMRCLEKLPEHRPQTAQSLLEELDFAATTSGDTVSPTSASGPLDDGRHRRGRRRWVVLLTAGAVLVGSGILVARALRNGDLMTAQPEQGQPAEGRLEGGEGSPERAAPGQPPNAPPPRAPPLRERGGRGPLDNPAGAFTGAGVAPGISGAPSGTGSRSGGQSPTADSARIPDSTAARRPLTLTHDDSLAIAEAVRRQIERRPDATRPLPGGRMRPGLLADALQRFYTDSVARALERLGRIPIPPNVDSLVNEQLRRHPPSFVIVGRRRLMMSDLEASSESEDLDEDQVTLLHDGFRERLAPFYDVLTPEDSPARARGNHNDIVLGRALRAGAVIHSVYTVRDDRLVVQASITDMALGHAIRTVQSDPVPAAEAVRALETLVPRVREALDAVRWSRTSVVVRSPAPAPIPPTPPAPPTP